MVATGLPHGSRGRGRAHADRGAYAGEVTPFRPVRTVADPDGRSWELYVTRVRLPPWRRQSGDGVDGPALAAGGRASLALALVTLPLALVEEIVLPLAIALFELPLALVRGAGSRERRIEAVTHWPHRQVYVWTTTPQQVDRVLAEVADGLERGEVRQPRGAQFAGLQE
jgi:hypothetical protein